MSDKHEDIVAHAIRAVAELPDRDSPDYWPEAMLVTAEELSVIIDEALRQVERETLERFSEVHRFLLGEGPLDGCWFGEKPPTERGQYWWRKRLRALIESGKALSPWGSVSV